MADLLKASFDKACHHLSTIATKIDSTMLLYLYARYKQATEGRCNIPRPGFFEFQAKQKWDAWNALGELRSEDAMLQYIEKINDLDPGWQEKQSAEASEPGTSQKWVSVSTMVNPMDTLPDEQKTIFDWCKEGNIDHVKKCLQESHIDITDDAGMTLLHWACDQGQEAMAEFLIKNHANIECVDVDGQTPLHYASSCGHVAVVQLLLNSHANTSVKNASDETPEEVAENENVKNLLSSWCYWSMNVRS